MLTSELLERAPNLCELLIEVLSGALAGGLTTRKFLREVFDAGITLNAIEHIIADWRAVVAKDPACHSMLAPLLGYKGFLATCTYRCAHEYWHSDQQTTALLLQGRACLNLGVDIHPAAQLGPGLMIDHGAGVVIGETVQAGKECVIYQGATLGARSTKDTGKRHPTLGNDVTIGASVLVGPVTLADGASVGAGSVVVNDVPANTTVVGIPARSK